MPGFVASLMLASATVSSADRAALASATYAIYAPYQQNAPFKAAWERDIWTREIQHLITHWQSVLPLDEPDAMNDGDWLCQCQDWDSHKFRVKIRSFKAREPGNAEVAATIILGHGTARDAILFFRREDARWLLDDMHTQDYPGGIKAGLRQTILDDEAMLKASK